MRRGYYAEYAGLLARIIRDPGVAIWRQVAWMRHFATEGNVADAGPGIAAVGWVMNNPGQSPATANRPPMCR